MKRFWLACLAAGALWGTATAHADATGPARIQTEPFVTLPDGVSHPEGLAADPVTGDVYVATFNFAPGNKLLRYGRNGQLISSIDFGTQQMLGLDYDSGYVYILNMGAEKVQRVPANFDSSTVPQDVANIPALPTGAGSRPAGVSGNITFGPYTPAPNAMVFDKAGNLYVSDSWQGAIFVVPPGCGQPCTAAVFKRDALLATGGFPPFGANGLAFNAGQSVMYIANTGDDRVLAMDMTLPTHELTVFAESINGADGVLFTGGLLWVCANQSDTVVALNASGRPVAYAGQFEGIAPDGAPRGLLFPASLAQVGDTMYVTNLALALNPTGVPAAEPEADVKRWTVSRFHIPK